MSTTSKDDHLLPSQGDTVPPALAPSTVPARQTIPLHPARSRHYRRTITIALFLLLACVLLLVGGIANPVIASLSPKATITLTPLTAIEQQTVTVQAVTGTPAKGQIQARLLEVHTPTQHITAAATGRGMHAAQVATGRITFFNLATYAITIPAGVILTGSDRESVITNSSVTVPAGNPPSLGSASVAAHAQYPGPSGNIAKGAINTLCCANGIVARNANPFTGGQNARSYTMLQQQDIQAAATPLVAALTQQAQSSLKSQLLPREQLIAPHCTFDVQANPPAGHEATQGAITVWVSCWSEAYNAQGVAELATASFQQQVSATLGSSYALTGRITTSSGQASVTNAQQGSLSIAVTTRGLWVFQIDRTAFRALLLQVAGKDPGTAQAILLRTPGVSHATIQLSGWNTGTLPTDVGQIELEVRTP